MTSAIVEGVDLIGKGQVNTLIIIMHAFRWDQALLRLSQHVPDLAEQSEILPLLAQQVRRSPISGFDTNCFTFPAAATLGRPNSLVALVLQADVDSAAIVEALTPYIMQPNATMSICSCFRPFMSNFVNNLHQRHDELAHTQAALYFTALVQILELAPHFQR